LAPSAFGNRSFGASFIWPNIEVSDRSKEVKVTADLAGLEEKDVDIHLADGALTKSGEKKTDRKTTTGCSVSDTTAGLNAAFPSTTSTPIR